MIGQMAIVIALHGFNDLGCSVTPIFLSRNFKLNIFKVKPIPIKILLAVRLMDSAILLLTEVKLQISL